MLVGYFVGVLQKGSRVSLVLGCCKFFEMWKPPQWPEWCTNLFMREGIGHLAWEGNGYPAWNGSM